MPELPELTVFADNLRKGVTGKKIVTAAYHGQKKLNVSPEELSRALVSAEITKVDRAGKQICFEVSNGNTFCIHLMLNGGFVLTKAQEVERLPSLVFSMTFADGSAMAVTDPKAWATVALNQRPDEKGVDGLSVTAEYLQAAFKKQPRKLAKAVLIDQAVIGGIGNAYSDEILWRAKVSPKSVVGKIPVEAIEALAEAIPAVLNEAIAEIRKRRPDTVSGEIREFLKVHGPGKKTSPTGAKVIKEQVQSKTTYYTDEQKLYE
jgi:formamidopyrimidine-DNA glycosylase